MLFLSSLIGVLLLSFGDSTGKTYVSFTDPTVNYSRCNHLEVDFMLYSSSMTKNGRIFLLGDSLIGQMCRDTKFCGKAVDGSVYTVNLTPNITSPTTWSYFRMHFLNGAPKVQIYHLGQYGGQIYIFEKELFWGFHPKANDILIMLFGAHFHDSQVFAYVIYIQTNTFYVHMYIYVYIYIYVYLRVFLFICIFTCIFIYICTYIYIYIHIYIIYMYVLTRP